MDSAENKKLVQIKLVEEVKLAKAEHDKITDVCFFENRANANKNVFQLWLANNKRLPFKVRRFSWHPTTYFVVNRVNIKEDYYEKTGKLYGEAFGNLFVRGTASGEDMKLQCAGCYQWEIIL